ADYILDATYRLQGRVLQLELGVSNPDTQDLPFGLGLHPYFRLPAEKAMMRTPPLERYVLQDCLPTGERMPLEGQHLYLRQGRPIGIHEFDDLYGVVPADDANLQDSTNRNQGALSAENVDDEVSEAPT